MYWPPPQTNPLGRFAGGFRLVYRQTWNGWCRAICASLKQSNFSIIIPVERSIDGIWLATILLLISHDTSLACRRLISKFACSRARRSNVHPGSRVSPEINTTPLDARPAMLWIHWWKHAAPFVLLLRQSVRSPCHSTPALHPIREKSLPNNGWCFLGERRIVFNSHRNFRSMSITCAHAQTSKSKARVAVISAYCNMLSHGTVMTLLSL